MPNKRPVQPAKESRELDDLDLELVVGGRRKLWFIDHATPFDGEAVSNGAGGWTTNKVMLFGAGS
jgi:hypothetical protein